MGVDTTLSLIGLDPLKKTSLEKVALLRKSRDRILLATLNIN